MSRLTILILGAAATAGLLGGAVVSAQTPTQPAPTATATVPTQTPTQVPPTLTPTPTATPTLPVTPTPDPNHPLGLRFAPPEGAPPGDFAYPALDGGQTYTGLSSVLTYAPQAGTLAPQDAQRFTVPSAEATVTSQAFSSIVRYASGTEFISFSSWTKSGEFEYVAPCCSPVSVARQTTIQGLPALTNVPSAAVSGGIGPVQVFFLYNGVIYSLDFQRSQREEALAMADRAAAWLVSRPPAPPATGEGPAASDSGTPWAPAVGAVIAGAVAVVAIGAGRRRLAR